MSRWQSSHDSQQINQIAQSTLEALESLSLESLSKTDMAEYARLLKVFRLLVIRLAKLDPELLPLNSTVSFTSLLSQAHGEIVSFGQNKNIGHLHNANSYVDNVLAVVKVPETCLGLDEFQAIASANVVFQEKTGLALDAFTRRCEDILAQIRYLSAEIDQGKVRIDENQQVIQQQKARLDQIIADFQRQFSDAQERRSSEFSDALMRNADGFLQQAKSFEGEFRDLSADATRKLDRVLEDSRKHSDTHLEFLERRRAEVDRIFGAIGTTAFAGSFKKTADQEAVAANRLRTIALGFMLAMTLIGGYTFYLSTSQRPEWQVFGFRIATAMVLAVPAAYAASESSKHRERERLNRKLHLELASIDAYLVLLPEDQRNKLKGELTEKFFGVPVLKEEKHEVTPKDLIGLLTVAVKSLSKGK